MVRTSGRLRLAAAGLVAFACTSDPQAGSSPPAFTVSGVVTHAGAPLPDVTALMRVHSVGGGQVAERTATTDADGRFQIVAELDTLLRDGYYFIFFDPVTGSGLRGPFRNGSIAFDDDGHADTTLAIDVERISPPVPTGPSLPLNPSQLVGRFSGESIEPIRWLSAGMAYLTLDLDSVTAAGPFGTFDISFSASTGCGGGAKSMAGTLAPDSLYLRLSAYTDPPAAEPRRQDFVVTSYDAGSDTLILRYTANGSNDCSWGTPAPLRLVREVGP